MLLVLLKHVVMKALCKIDVHLISTLVNKSLYYYMIHFTTINETYFKIVTVMRIFLF